jgi:hypothetical protein
LLKIKVQIKVNLICIENESILFYVVYFTYLISYVTLFCPKPWHGFPMSYVICHGPFIIVQCLEEVVHFVDIGGIVDHHLFKLKMNQFCSMLFILLTWYHMSLCLLFINTWLNWSLFVDKRIKILKIIKWNLNRWWSTIPPISTKWTTSSKHTFICTLIFNNFSL